MAAKVKICLLALIIDDQETDCAVVEHIAAVGYLLCVIICLVLQWRCVKKKQCAVVWSRLCCINCNSWNCFQLATIFDQVTMQLSVSMVHGCL